MALRNLALPVLLVLVVMTAGCKKDDESSDSTTSTTDDSTASTEEAPATGTDLGTGSMGASSEGSTLSTEEGPTMTTEMGGSGPVDLGDDDEVWSWGDSYTEGQCNQCRSNCRECDEARAAGCRVGDYNAEGRAGEVAEACVKCMTDCLSYTLPQ